MNVEQAVHAVAPIIADVRERGEEALLDYAQQFDHVRPGKLKVPEEELEKAARNMDPRMRQAIELSIAHNRAGHTAQLPRQTSTQIVEGGFVRQRWIPVRRVGLYVPGGLAVYPSSVVMNAVCAQVAGVEEIALASPPQKEFGGLPHPTILAACHMLGLKEVYAVGGAQAIAMFAYGAKCADSSPLCESVDVVTGPGNVYVAAAKRAVRSVVGIDAEAGTTEIAIIADDSAQPLYVAADLISQAEHDPAAASVLITDSLELVEEVEASIDKLMSDVRHAQRVKTALSGPQSGIVLVDSMEEAVTVANAYAAEHLEIHAREAAAISSRIRNAGAIFIGPYSPVPLGDYMAGSNHVLPTGGTARFVSGLNVHAFIKSVQEVEYTREALTKVYEPLRTMAEGENLPAHAQSLAIRIES